MQINRAWLRMTGGCSAKKNMTFRKYDENILVMEEKKKGNETEAGH